MRLIKFSANSDIKKNDYSGIYTNKSEVPYKS